MKKITVVCIGTINHELMKSSIETSSKVVPDCEDILVFSDKKVVDYGRWVEINSKFSINDYNLFCIKSLLPFIKTEFVLIIQYDGIAVKKKFWSDKYYKYDYTGAPWPDRFKWIHTDEKVGNGGFSLRSTKLLEALKNHQIRFHDDSPRFKNEDALICQGYKKYLENQYSIKYAPIDIASQFSTEWTNISGNTFGFHGAWNTPLYFKENQVLKYIEHIDNSYWLDDKIQFFVQGLKSKNYNHALNYFQKKLTIKQDTSIIAT